MQLNKIRRLASQILKTGQNKVWLNPAEMKRISEALTKDDVRQLITERIVKKQRPKGHSRGAARILRQKKKKGRKRGFGKRRGTQKARVQKKKRWISAVRGQRKFLADLKEKKTVDSKTYTLIYKRIKGGYFKGKKQIEAMVASVKKE